MRVRHAEQDLVPQLGETSLRVYPHLEGAVETDTLPALDQLAFRKVMGHFASGVTVITARVGGQNYGMTANAFTSLSLEPPLVVVCLAQQTRTRGAIAECGRFGVNILRDDQGSLAERFAERDVDRFAGIELLYGEMGQPLIAGALAHIECYVVEEVPGGTHSILVGGALRASADDGLPLGYFRGSFGYFLSGDDAAVHATLRRQIVNHELPVAALLDPIVLAAEFGAEPDAVHRALSRLSRDRLLVREENGYRIPGVDFEAIAEVIAARCVIEVGAAEATVGVVEREELDDWEALAALPCSACPGPRGTSSSGDFHERMISFSRNSRLLAQYKELSVDQFPWAGQGVSRAEQDKLVRDHLEMVDGYRRGDVAAVANAARRHSRRLRTAWLEASPLDAGGGAE